MAELSKTARASMRVGTGVGGRVPTHWVYAPGGKPGRAKLPYQGCYNEEEANAVAEAVGGYVVFMAALTKGNK